VRTLRNVNWSFIIVTLNCPLSKICSKFRLSSRRSNLKASLKLEGAMEGNAVASCFHPHRDGRQFEWVHDRNVSWVKNQSGAAHTALLMLSRSINSNMIACKSSLSYGDSENKALWLECQQSLNIDDRPAGCNLQFSFGIPKSWWKITCEKHILPHAVRWCISQTLRLSRQQCEHIVLDLPLIFPWRLNPDPNAAVNADNGY